MIFRCPNFNSLYFWLVLSDSLSTGTKNCEKQGQNCWQESGEPCTPKSLTKTRDIILFLILHAWKISTYRRKLFTTGPLLKNFPHVQMTMEFRLIVALSYQICFNTLKSIDQNCLSKEVRTGGGKGFKLTRRSRNTIFKIIPIIDKVFMCRESWEQRSCLSAIRSEQKTFAGFFKRAKMELSDSINFLSGSEVSLAHSLCCAYISLSRKDSHGLNLDF